MQATVSLGAGKGMAVTLGIGIGRAVSLGVGGVRNMVFFELFLSYFMTFRLVYLLPILSLRFTLPRKDKTHAIDFKT